MRIDINDVQNLEVDGVCRNDYPRFTDAYFSYAEWKENGDELTDDQLDWLTEDYPEIVNEMAFEKWI